MWRNCKFSGTYDPYTVPAAVFQSLKAAKSLPEFHFGNVLHMSCGEVLPFHCCQDESIQKCRRLYVFWSGWVNNADVWGVKDKNIFIVKAQVGAN